MAIPSPQPHPLGASCRYVKSTVNNIQLIDSFRHKKKEEARTKEERLFDFWMEFFVEGIKEDPGTPTQLPVSLLISL